MNPNLHHLRTVQLLAKCDTFQEVGNILGISGAAVSKQISSLESQLGSPVIIKAARKISFTTFGIEFLAHINSIIDQVDALERWNNIQQDSYSGTVRIMSHDDHIFSNTIVPWLGEFHNQFPNIRLKVMESKPFTDTSKMGADIYWGVGKYLGEIIPGLIGKEILSFDYGIYASPEYLIKHGTPKNINDLALHSMIATNRTVPSNHIFYYDKTQHNNIGCEKVNVSITIQKNLLDVAKQGLGLINYSDSAKTLREAIMETSLVPVLEGYWIRDMKTYAYYDTSSITQTHIKAFIDFFTSKLELANTKVLETSTPSYD